jgi:hypothetical protein
VPDSQKPRAFARGSFAALGARMTSVEGFGLAIATLAIGVALGYLAVLPFRSFLRELRDAATQSSIRLCTVTFAIWLFPIDNRPDNRRVCISGNLLWQLAVELRNLRSKFSLSYLPGFEVPNKTMEPTR